MVVPIAPSMIAIRLSSIFCRGCWPVFVIVPADLKHSDDGNCGHRAWFWFPISTYGHLKNIETKGRGQNWPSRLSTPSPPPRLAVMPFFYYSEAMNAPIAQEWFDGRAFCVESKACDPHRSSKKRSNSFCFRGRGCRYGRHTSDAAQFVRGAMRFTNDSSCSL